MTIHAALKKHNSIAAYLCLLLLIDLLMPISALAAGNKPTTIRVGFFAFDGYHEIDENGEKSGYGYDFLTLMKRYADVNYEYVGYDKSWSDMQQMLLGGEIDMVTSAHKTADREEQFDFSLPIGTNTINLNVRAGETRYTTGNYSGYDGMKIGMIAGSSSNDKFAAFAQEKGFAFSAVYYTDSDALEEALLNGDVDAVVSSSLRKIHEEKILEEFNTEAFYAIVRKGDTALLDQINYAIRQMNCNEGDWKNTLYYSNYLAENHASVHFTETELAYIQKYSNGSDKITFAVDTNWIPFAWMEKGEYTGILPDIISYCMKQCGMDYVIYTSDQNIFDASVMENEQVDMYIGYSLNDEYAENNGFVATDSVLDCGTAYLLRKETLDIKTVAVCATTPYLNTRLQAEDGITLKEYPNTLSARNAVINQEVDAAFLYDYDAQYTANHDLSGGLAYELISNGDIHIKAVMRCGDDRTLMSIWMKCMRHMTDAEKNVIVSKYISHTATSMTLKDYVLLHPFVFMGAGLLIVALIAITVGILIKSRANQRHRLALEEKVNEITALNDQLQENQAQLEESAAEQEAQLEEITALNSELEERQAQLEEATAEQESQIEEITGLNNQLAADSELIQKQFALSEAVSRDTNEIFVLDIQSGVSTTIKLGGVMVEKNRQISRDYNATWAWYLKKYVHPEDKDTLAEATKLDTVLAELTNKIEYCIRYRIIVGEELRYFQVVFSHLGGKESNQIVFSFRCIDDIVRDEIEQRKHLEAANEIAAARLQEIESLNVRFKENLDIIANAGFGIWRITMKPNGHHTMDANGTLQKIFGITDMNLSPEELYTYYHGRLRQNVSEIENNDYAQMSGGKLKTRILEWEHPTKGVIILSAGGTSYSETDEGMVISGYCGEITEQRRELEKLNQQLEAALKQAKIASKSKSDFLFSMSHDIRTPMNAIIGYANLMQKYQDDKERCSDYLSKIISSSDFLLDLINDVLEMARIESGKMVLDEAPMGTVAFNDSLYAVFAEGMKQKNLAYTRSIEIQNEVVFCDSVKTREIFLNLLSNAMKYTPAGGSVHMALKELPSDREGYALMQTTITDTGIGMSAEYLPHLFEEFSREQTVTENKIQGTGLGMPIVKKLVNLMGGTISVTSELGKGTTFVVRLYHRISSAEALQKADAPADIACDFTGKHILLAEDNDLNAEIAIEILKETGAEVDRAEDGIICIDMLRKSDPGYYDLILMDIQMPNLNGYETTEKIRRAGFDIPIIAMTANAFEEDKQDALRAGMNGHVAKPIDVAELMKTLAEVLSEY